MKLFSVGPQRSTFIDPSFQASKSKASLTRQDWDFDNLDSKELQMCVLYELARESKLIADLIKSWNTWKKRGIAWHAKHGTETANTKGDLEQARLWKKSRDLPPSPMFGFDHLGWDSFINNLGCLGGMIPWQSLSLEVRAQWNLIVTQNPAIYSGYELDAFMVVDSLRKKWKTLESDAEREAKESGSEIIIPSWPEASAMGDDGRERVVLVIDWATYDKAAILHQFEAWLKIRKPPVNSRIKTRAGHGKNKLRALLKNIGQARLRAEMTPREIYDKNRDAWNWLVGSKPSPESCLKVKRMLSDGMKNLKRNFHKYFPKHGDPISVSRFSDRR